MVVVAEWQWPDGSGLSGSGVSSSGMSGSGTSGSGTSGSGVSISGMSGSGTSGSGVSGSGSGSGSTTSVVSILDRLKSARPSELSRKQRVGTIWWNTEHVMRKIGITNEQNR